MTLKHKLRLTCAVVVPAAVCTVAGLPLTSAMTHGFDPATWPQEAMQPALWWHYVTTGRLPDVIAPYVQMMEGRAPSFSGGGRIQFWGLLGSCAAIPFLHVLTRKSVVDDRRDASGQLGNARWANAGEKAAMRRGLEVGIDPKTSRPICVAIESNALSVAPPRTGKTSGLIIPNLLAATASAWNGPIVIIDPKGEVFAATAGRRAELGRKVVRFDLRRDARNSHQWNPLAGIALDDTERLLAMARVCVVEGGTENAYFSDRAVDVLAGTMAAEMHDASRAGRQPTIAGVAHLLSAPEELLAIARTGDTQILRSLTGDLQLDERSRDQLLSTAKTAVAWLQEERFGRLTAHSTFSMAEVVRGHIDLFIIVSPNSMKLLAPLLRLMLADIMVRAMTDRRRGDERLLVLTDETATLGKFAELEQAVGLLPGLGVSFWTFWQGMGQIQKLYGPGFRTFVDTAEVVTFSDFARLGKDAEEISSALGKYTAFVEATSAQKSATGLSSGTSKAKQAVPLMTADALRNMPSEELIVLVNSKRYSKHPLRLRKTKYFDDPRFDGLYRDVQPTKAL